MSPEGVVVEVPALDSSSCGDGAPTPLAVTNSQHSTCETPSVRSLPPLDSSFDTGLRQRRRGRRFRSYSSGDLRTMHDDDDDDDDVVDDRWRAPPARFTTPSPRPKRRLIPADHPFKLLWDILTMIMSFANAYATHQAIRDRAFCNTTLSRFFELWFVVDLLLNFCTERRTFNGVVLKTPRAVWGRYLTTWFAVDLLSLFPGESLYVQPIIDMQNRRGFLRKSFFRTRAVIRVTRFLRGRHLKLFGQVARHTKLHAGVGSSRLLRLLIRYVPKYILFVKNMKGVLAIRILRQVHWVRKVWYNYSETKEDAETDALTADDGSLDSIQLNYIDDTYY